VVECLSFRRKLFRCTRSPFISERLPGKKLWEGEKPLRTKQPVPALFSGNGFLVLQTPGAAANLLKREREKGYSVERASITYRCT